MAIPVKNKDRFLLPVKDGGITKAYGVKDSRYYKGMHLGIDFGWWENPYDDVYCIQEGTVCATFWASDKGNVVVIQHLYEDGTHRYSSYIHLNSISVAYGQQVKQGDVIGKRGSTGSASNGVHLHIYVGKATTETINLSKSVREENWKKFLDMCDFNPLSYFEKSKKISYNMSPSFQQTLSGMRWIEDDQQSTEVEELRAKVKELTAEVQELQAQVDNLKVNNDIQNNTLKNIYNECRTAIK